MRWYIELEFNSPRLNEKMYFTTRAEARRKRNWYMSWSDIKKATVRKVL